MKTDDTKAIKVTILDCQKHALENKSNFLTCPYTSKECDGWHDCRCLENGKDKGCLKEAKEFLRLSKWLQELLNFRSQVGK